MLYIYIYSGDLYTPAVGFFCSNIILQSIKKNLITCFPCEFHKTFQKRYSTEHLSTAVFSNNFIKSIFLVGEKNGQLMKRVTSQF